MKIALLTICRNEMQHLPDYIKWNRPLVDLIFAYDDNSSDLTKEYLEENGVNVIGKDISFFKSEMFIRSKLLKYAKNEHPDIDWFLFLDADELLLCNRSELEQILAIAEKNKCSGVQFHLINLWKSTINYRKDNGFDDVRKVHAWKNSSKLSFQVETGLHKQLHPHSISRILRQEKLRIIHLGFSSSAKILEKFSLYRNLGQQGSDLWRILDESTLDLESVEELRYSVGSNFEQWHQEQKGLLDNKELNLIEIVKHNQETFGSRSTDYPYEKPLVTLICLVYQGIEWLELIYGEMLKLQSELEFGMVEILICANDATSDVIDFLKNNRIPHFLYENDDPNEYYIKRVYRAYNQSVRLANGRYCLLINSDMVFCPAFLTILLDAHRENLYQVGKLVESGALKPSSFAVERNFGKTLTDFDQGKFERFLKKQKNYNLVFGGLYMPALVSTAKFLEIGGFPEGNISPNSLEQYIETGNYAVATEGASCISGDAAFISRAEKLGLTHKTNSAALVYHFQEGEKRSSTTKKGKASKSGMMLFVDNIELEHDTKPFKQFIDQLKTKPRIIVFLREEKYLEIVALKIERRGKRMYESYEVKYIRNIDHFDRTKSKDVVFWVNEKIDKDSIVNLIAGMKADLELQMRLNDMKISSRDKSDSEIGQILTSILKDTFYIRIGVSNVQRILRRIRRPKLVYCDS